MSATLEMQSSSAYCTVCGQCDTRQLLEKFSLEMFQCASCKVVFTSPMFSQQDTLARYSQAWFEQEYLPCYGIDPAAPSLDHLQARHHAELAPAYRFRQNNRLLDVGAGAGLFLATARAAGWQVEGVEVAGYGPEYAKKHFGLHIFHGVLQDAKFPDNYFDVVMLQDTIEHVSNPRGLLEEINRIARIGGAVILSTPNFDSLARRLLGVKWSVISPFEHVYLFTMPSLLQILRATNFEPYRLETDAYINPDFVHGERSVIVEAVRKVLSLANRPYIRPLIYKLSLGDKIDAIAVKQHTINEE